MVGKDSGTRKRKGVVNDQASDKKKKKLIYSNKNEDGVTTDVPMAATISKKKKLISSNKNKDGPTTDAPKTATISQRKKKLISSKDGVTTDVPKAATISKKKKLISSNKNEDTTDVPKTATISQRKKRLISSNKTEVGPTTDVLKTATISQRKKKLISSNKTEVGPTTAVLKTATISQRKKKLISSNKNEDGPTTDVPKTATINEKKRKQEQKATDMDIETDSPTGQVKPQSDSVKVFARKKLKKKPLPLGRRKGFEPYIVPKKKKVELKRGAELNESCHKAKKLWEKGRRLDCAAEEQTSLTAEVHVCLAGKIPQIIFSHDMARVIQWLIKHSNEQRVAEIAKECSAVIVRMSQSKYAKYCVLALMRQRNETVKKLIIDKLFGNIVTLTTHPIAASVIGEAYERCFNNLLRNHMKQEIYSSLFTKQKNDKIKDLKDMFQNYPELKDSTLNGMNNIFTKVFDRKLQKSSLIHDVLLDFLEVCPDKMGAELAPLVLQSGNDFVTTKNGAMALLKSFSLVAEEERKQFLENLQENVPKLACSESGHFLLIALLAYVDDISLMEETVLKGLIDQLPEIASHVHGSKVLLHIISTEKLPSLPPKLTRMLKLDLDRVKASRKKKALLDIMLNPLLQSVSSKPEIWLADGPVSVATFNILKSGKGPELAAAFESLAKHVATSKAVIKHYGKDYTVVEHPGIHKILRKLIEYDPLPSQEVKGSFGSALMKHLTDETIKEWLESSRGCFMLSFVLNKTKDTKLKKKIGSELTDEVKSKMKTFSGGEVLLEQLNS